MANISALIAAAKLALAHADADLADGAARLKNIVTQFIRHHETEQEPAPEPAPVAAKGKGKVSTADVADTAVVAAEVEPQPE